MKYLPTGAQMREADSYTIQKLGMPSMVLMERAALCVVEAMERERFDLSRVLVVCGPGNNGGDGYAVARLLHEKGYDVETLFVGKEESRSEDNRKQKEIAEKYGVLEASNAAEKEYSVVVDAVFGTGLARNLEGRFYDVISMLNQKKARKVSIDIPSGIQDTTGEIMGIAFQADMTVAIAFIKRGLVFYPGHLYAGKIVTGQIGIPEEALPKESIMSYGYEPEDLKMCFPKRIPNSHKGTYGKVLLIAGSSGMCGAAYLNARAAYAVGAGLVQIYTVEENRIILQQLLPEAIITTYEAFEETELNRLLNWADVVGIGSGLGQSETAEKLVEYTMKHALCPCVADADALNILSEHLSWISKNPGEADGAKSVSRQMVLTPHLKEMARLLDCTVRELTEERIPMLEAFVSEYPVICALKDARTLVAGEGEQLYMNLSGNAAMAKAGSGDVLTGIIAGLLAQKPEAYSAACLGVYLHGLSGDAAKQEKGSYSVLAGDLIDGIGKVLKEL